MPVSPGTRLDRQVSFVLEKKSPKIFENIWLNNGVLAALGVSGRVKIVKGGDEFHERTHLGANSNVGFRGKFAQIPTNFQNNFLTAKYAQAVISGSVPLNEVEEMQNAPGKQRISSIADAMVEELMNTFPNTVSDSLMASAPGNSETESIRQRIEATAFGSQTSSLGGISRASYPGTNLYDAWQNQYSATAITDIGSAAGLAAISRFLWTCSPGGGAKNQQPDVGLTTTGVYAKITGTQDNLRRYTVNDRMLKLGFSNIQINNAVIMADRNVPDGYLYALNTNYLRLQVLAGAKTKVTGNVKTIGDGRQSIPLQVSSPIESIDYLNKVIKVFAVMNLTFGGLRQHGLQISITEA